VRYGYEISNELNKQNRLSAYQNNLKIELARLKSPERITQIAKQQLDLITPTADKTILMP
jgi:cell division protein FtsL